jgi:hypothetical protein
MPIEEEASDKELSVSPSNLKETRRYALNMSDHNRKYNQSALDKNDVQRR